MLNIVLYDLGVNSSFIQYYLVTNDSPLEVMLTPSDIQQCLETFLSQLMGVSMDI